MKRTMLVCFITFITLNTLAAEAQPWKAKAGLGYLATAGNSESTNVSASFDAGYETGRWHHTLGLLAIGAESTTVVNGNENKQSTAERYALALKSKWDIHTWDYAYGSFDYDKDKFSGVEQSISETVGYGRRFINNDVHVLNGEIGIGLRQQEFIDGTDDSGAIIKLGGDYLYNFSPTAKFSQTLSFEIGSENTYTQSVSAINAKLREALALVFKYTIKNNTDVPAGLDKTDTFTSINLEYSF